MDEDRTPSGLRRVEPDEAPAHDHINGQNANSRISDGRTRGGGSNTLRASDADAPVRRDGSRWSDILTGVLTALTTFLLLELLVWGMRLPAGSDRLDTSYGIGAADWVTGFWGCSPSSSGDTSPA